MFKFEIKKDGETVGKTVADEKELLKLNGKEFKVHADELSTLIKPEEMEYDTDSVGNFIPYVATSKMGLKALLFSYVEDPEIINNYLAYIKGIFNVGDYLMPGDYIELPNVPKEKEELFTYNKKNHEQKEIVMDYTSKIEKSSFLKSIVGDSYDEMSDSKMLTPEEIASQLSNAVYGLEDDYYKYYDESNYHKLV